MNDLKLGEIIIEPRQRDAAHVAVAPVIAATRLSPGTHINFVAGNTTKVIESHSNPIGIVDPFLDKDVCKGQTFWMFLYPGTITSLRHDWSHPAFDDHSLKQQESRFSWQLSCRSTG